MHKLATKIQEQLDNLAETYEQRLRDIEGFAALSEQVRRDDARALLDLIAVALESGDETEFVQFVQTQVDVQVQQGFKIEALSKALTHVQETLMPLVTSAESAKFLWRVFSQVRTAMSIQTHQELRASEKQFRELVDNTAAGVFIHQGGILQFVGRKGVHILGYETSDQLVGRSIMDFIAEEARARVGDIARRRLAGEPVPSHYETRLLKKNGTPVDVLLFSMLIEHKGQPATQGTFVDISERVQVNKELYQQSALLRGVAEAAEQLLTIPDPGAAIDQALATLGAALDVDRVYIFENHPHSETGEPAMSQRFEWVRASVEPQMGKPELQNVAYHPFWYDRLSVGKTVNRLTKEFPPAVRQALESQDILSLLAVPIAMDGHFWGYVGFDDCRSERRWSESEEAVLMIAAGGIGGVIRRRQLERAIQKSLEHRGRQMQTSTLIAQRIAAAPTLDELYRRVVTLVKEQFSYYHAQIFRYELALNAVVLVSGYGEIGEQMLDANYSLALGHGIIGSAAATGRTVLASDTARHRNWVSSSLLPDIRSEIAVPIKLRDQVLGILAVQSDRVNALTTDTQLLLEGLCGQVATAIESTRLRQEMEENLRELNAMYRTTSREGWQDFRETAALPGGYRFDRTAIQSDDELWMPEIEQAVAQGKLIASDEEDARQVAVAPLSARGEILGALGVHDDPQHPLSAEELALVETVSEQVGLALESARLFEQTQTALNQTEALYAGSGRVIRATTMDQVMQALIQSTALRQLDQVSFVIFDNPWETERPTGMTVAAIWERGVKSPRTPVGTRLVPERFPIMGLFRKDAPLIVPDIAIEERIEQETRTLFLEQLGMQSLIILPLIVGDQWIGVLSALGSGTLHIDEGEIRRITSLTDQAATVIQTVRLVEQTQSALFETSALHQAGAALNAAQSHKAVLSALRRYTVLGQADRVASIDMFDRPWSEDDWPDWIIVIARWPHMSREVAEQRYLAGDYASFFGLIGPDEPMIIADAETDPRLDENLRTLFVQRFGARSVLSVPLVVGGRWVGYVNAQYSEITHFAETEIRRLTALTAQAAVAIQSLRQLEAIQARVQREQHLREITARLRTPPDVDGVMRVLTQELGQVLGRRTAVRLSRHEFLDAVAGDQEPGHDDGD